MFWCKQCDENRNIFRVAKFRNRLSDQQFVTDHQRRKMSKLPIASFGDLPDEIILRIFTHLELYDNASASQVCLRWKLLSEDQSIWQKINLIARKSALEKTQLSDILFTDNLF